MGRDDQELNWPRRGCILVCLALLLMLVGLPAGASPLAASAAAQERAVSLARAGEFNEALAILGELHQQSPDSQSVTYDYLSVLGWAGRDGEAVALAEGLPLDLAPAYVLEAVGKAQRNTRRFEEATALYARALARFPGHRDFIEGHVYALAEAGDFGAADERIARLRAQHPRELWPLRLDAYVATLRGDFLAVLDRNQRILALAPENPAALRGRILALEALGATHRAQVYAEQHPHLFSRIELLRLHTGRAAQQVRWGSLEPVSEDLRFTETDRALALIEENLAGLDAKDPVARPFVFQGRFDRLVALRDRVRMAEAAAEYESLSDEGISPPAYALQAAAEAYLHLRKPEVARDLYLRVLAEEPENFEAGLGLFYAYIETEDFLRAYDLVDRMQAKQPVWRQGRGVGANRERLDADVAAGLARVFANDLTEGQRRFATMHAIAPHNPDLVRELANIYAARGWPRLAQQTYADGLGIALGHPGLQMGHAATRLDLREYDEAQAEIADLYRRFPENRQVQRLRLLWDTHELRELRAEAAYADSSGAEPSSQELRLGSTLFSSPFLTHYRAFISGFWSQADFPEGRGIYQRYGGGLEYLGRDLIASLAASANHSDGDDLGLAFSGTWYRDDHWSFPFSLEMFSADTPLRALRNDVDADAARLGVDYRQSELRSMGLGGQIMDFSDGNQSGRMSAYWRERLVTRSHYKLDGVVDLYASTQRRDDVPYFSPEQDFSAELTLDNDWLLYRRYSRTFGHRLALSGGGYWQKGFGANPVAAILYEHNWQADYRFSLSYGAVLSRRVYDGDGETGVEYYLRLGWRL